MYDTVFFRLSQGLVRGVSFLDETPCYLDDVGEHSYNGCSYITGNINGLKVTVSENQIKVKDGSLCKFLFGNNFQTMGRQDAKRAIEKLSDMLHLPMDRALITRFDLAQNIIVKHPPEVYFNHLGALRYASRLQEPNGIYYDMKCGRLCFYDKNYEQKSKGETIPELYSGRNVLRYERRFTQRIAATFSLKEVTGALLYDESFYVEALNRWLAGYRSIQKINDFTINFQAMKTKQQLYRMGILSLTEQAGGQLEMINQINNAQRRGEISKKQAFDLRNAVKNACQIRDGITTQSEAINELDKKVEEAVRFYR